MTKDRSPSLVLIMLVSAFVSLWAIEALAVDYFVDATGGLDANAGTSARAAWKTVAKAQATAGAGATIFFKRGETWFETYTFPADNIILDAYGSGPRPILDGGGVRRKVVNNLTHTGTTTRNLHLRNTGGGTGGIWEVHTGTNTIEHCTVETSAFDSGVAAGASAYMIVRYCDISNCKDEGATQHATSRALIQHCNFFRNTEGINNSGSDMQLTVEDCTFWDNGDGKGAGGDIGGLSVTATTFNRCRFNGRADGAAFKFYTGAESAVVFNYCIFDASHSLSPLKPGFNANSPTAFNNCVFYGGASSAASHGAIAASSTITVTNCIAMGWSRFAYIFPGGSFTTANSTLYELPASATPSNMQTKNTNVLTTNPLFTAAATGDFTILANSPAIDSGVNIGLLLDLAGNPVGKLPERGAYEFGSRPVPAAAPHTPVPQSTTRDAPASQPQK